MKFYFTSDTHFWHKNILSYCGRTEFMTDEERKEYEKTPGQRIRISTDSIRRMNDAIINDINSVVGENDVLVHLGDFAFGDYRQIRDIRNQIRCRNIYLSLGNHDKNVLKALKSGYYCDQPFRIPPIGSLPGVFNAVFYATELRAFNRNIFLSHYAHAIWNKSHRGAWHLYGHSHAGFEPYREKLFPGRPMMDVGVDNRFRLYGDWKPFSLADIERVFSTYTGSTGPLDHHVGPPEERE